MRRLVLRRLRADDGSTLVETVVALLVFALIMTGLAGSMTMFAHSTALTKARSAATSTAQQLVETARSQGTANLSVCAGGGSPATFPFQGTSYPVLTSSAAGCLPFSSTQTRGGNSFAVKQYVLQKDAKTNTAGIPQTEKVLIVKLSWTTPTAGSYEVDTVMNNNGTPANSPPQGIRMNVNDQNGALINISADIWDYTITDATNTQVASGSTEDGTTGVLSLVPGSYTCSIVAEADAGQSYSPGTNPGMTLDVTNDTISGPCTVTANIATDWTTVWNEISSCAASTTKGSVAVTVKDQAGGLVSGAAVSLTNVNSGAVIGPVNTTSAGVATFAGNVADDLYSYSISKPGYTTAANLGPVCVSGTGTTTASGSVSTVAPTCASVGAKGTVTVTVTDENGNLLQGVKVVLANQSGKASPGSVNTNSSGVALFNNNVTGDSYTYTMTKTGYTNPGPQGPVCVTPATNTQISGLLPTAGSTGCASSSSKGTLTITVADQSGTGLNAVKVTLTNANGHAGTPAAKNTATVGGVDGVVTWSNAVPGDPYLFTITPPAGYSNPGTLGPVCVIAGQSVQSSATLVGQMTAKITVTNSDVQPTKTYNVSITDSSSHTTSSSITVNRNKSATVTFASMPTDTYTLSVCVPIAATGNCDSVNNTAATYAWTAISTTYSLTVTDTKGGA